MTVSAVCPLDNGGRTGYNAWQWVGGPTSKYWSEDAVWLSPQRPNVVRRQF